jgi:hypothetical protein
VGGFSAVVRTGNCDIRGLKLCVICCAVLCSRLTAELCVVGVFVDRHYRTDTKCGER